MADAELRQTTRDFLSDPSDAEARRLITQQARSGLTATKVFAVVKHTFQYNDENYWGGGFNQQEAYALQKVYVNQATAQKQCSNQNLQEFIDLCIDPWSTLSEWTENKTLTDPTDMFTIGLSPEDAAILWKDLAKYEIYNPNSEDDYLWQQTNHLSNDVKELFKDDAVKGDPAFLALIDRVRQALGICFFEVVEMTLEDGIVGSI